jgi:ribulose kinase
MSSKYAVRVDFGTESGRAVLVDVTDGHHVATAVYQYQNGVIADVLPLAGNPVRLEPDWALQDPEDYVRTLQVTVHEVLSKAAVDPLDAATLVRAGADDLVVGRAVCDAANWSAAVAEIRAAIAGA